MVASYPIIEEWGFGDGLLQRTVEGVRAIGQSRREAGAFWLGKREVTAHVYSLVLPHGIGVEESSGRWVVSAEVFGAITRWAKPRDLCLLGIVHSHVRGVPPILSWTDRNLGVRVPGIIAAVIGNAGEDRDHLDWGWYVFEQGDYRQLTRKEIKRRIRVDSAIGFEVWTADSNGVHVSEE